MSRLLTRDEGHHLMEMKPVYPQEATTLNIAVPKHTVSHSTNKTWYSSAMDPEAGGLLVGDQADYPSKFKASLGSIARLCRKT